MVYRKTFGYDTRLRILNKTSPFDKGKPEARNKTDLNRFYWLLSDKFPKFAGTDWIAPF